MRERAVLFDLISARAGWLAQRQAVLGQNVANADTPGFRPLDLAPASFERLLQGGWARSRPHLAGARDGRRPLRHGSAPGRSILRDRPLG